MSEKSMLLAKSDAKKLKNNKEYGKQCLALGAYYRDKGLLEKAFKEFLEYYELAQGLESDRINEAKALREMGELKVDMKEYGEGLKLIKKYLNVSKSINNQLEIQRALTTLGRSYYIYALDLNGEADRQNKLEYADSYSKQAFEAIPSQTSAECPSLERKKMKSVIFTNRYTILNLLGRDVEAEEVFMEGENLMSEAKFNLELFRLYDIKVGVLEEKGDHLSALEASSKSFKVLEHLRDTPGFQDIVSDALRQRARIFVALGDFESAKKPLVQAYKQRNTKSEHWQDIVSMLKGIIRILELTSEISYSDDSLKVSRLNEKVADICVNLEFFEVAIDFYKRALAIAEKNTSDTKRTSRLCYSIAQTYEDLGMYAKASSFYKKDLEYGQSLKPLESLPSILGLAQCAEKNQADHNSTMEYYLKAREIAKSSGSTSKEVDVLIAMAEFMSKSEFSEDAVQKVKSEIEKLESSRGFEDNEPDVDERNDESGSDESIDLEKALEDELEPPLSSENRSKRKSSKGKFQTKVNQHGESRLHVLCKDEGNLADLKFLIKAGQSVNCKDYAGFTPLHDACVAGRLEYAQLLVQSGANVNAQNGNGVTPLMDACEAGALDVIQFLLESGCDPNLRDKHNWNAADHLRYYLENLDSPEEESLKVLTNLESIIVEDPKIVKASKSAVEMIGDSGGCFIEDDLKKSSKNIKELRTQQASRRSRVRTFSSSDDERAKERLQSPSRKKSVKLYTGIIQSLRGSRPKAKPFAQKRINTNNLRRSLEDDISSDDENREDQENVRSGSKRKTPDDLRLGSQKRPRKNSTELEVIDDKEQNLSWKSQQDSLNDFFDDPFFHTEELNDRLNAPVIRKIADTSESSLGGRQIEIETGNVGEKLSSNKRKDLQSVEALVGVPQLSLQRNKTTLGSERPVTIPNKMRVNVAIAGKVLLVPIGLEEKVSDLLDEIANRQFSNTGQRPLMKILTTDGAELHPSDSLCDIFGDPCGVINVQVEISGFKVCPMEEIYKSFCQAKNDPVFGNVVQCLSLAQENGIVSLPSGNLSGPPLLHFFKAIHHQSVIVELDIPGCRLGLDQSTMAGLCIALQSIPQLKKLNVSHNGLETSEVQQLADSFLSTSSEKSTLSHLNLSFNELCIGNTQGLLALISRLPHLTSLDISHCQLSEKDIITKKIAWQEALKNNRSTFLKTLNISGNDIQLNGLEVILDCLDPLALTSLDASDCCHNEESDDSANIGLKIANFVGNGGPDAALSYLNIGRNGLDFQSIKDLGKGFYHFESLTHLDMSYNREMSTAAFLHLLGDIWTHNVPLLKLNAVGCFDQLENHCEILQAINKIPRLEVTFSLNDILCERLSEMAIEHSNKLTKRSSTIQIASVIS